MTTLPAPFRVGSQTFKAGTPIPVVEAKIDGVMAVNADLGADNQVLRAEIARLRRALQPFAEVSDELDDCENLVDDPDRCEDVQLIFGGFTPGTIPRDDFRNARKALPVSSEGGE